MTSVKRALITGVSGQDGGYLAESLLADGYVVHGLVRTSDNPSLEEIRRRCPGIEFVEGDLLDQASLIRALETAGPDEVYNLAAISSVALSFREPVLTGEVGGLGAARLLEAIRMVDPTIRCCQASSSEVFGAASESPQRETTTHRPRNPYAAAKSYAHHMTQIYRESHGLFACNAILFNHESPRRGPEFVTRKITRAAARISLGLDEGLTLGNLDVQRDWGFAGDYVDAMHRMLLQDTPDDYVVATGTAHTVREFCHRAFAHVGLDAERYVVSDPEFFRPVDADILVGDATKARSRLGWEPTVSFSGLVAMMVDGDLLEARAGDSGLTGGSSIIPP